MEIEASDTKAWYQLALVLLNKLTAGQTEINPEDIAGLGDHCYIEVHERDGVMYLQIKDLPVELH